MWRIKDISLNVEFTHFSILVGIWAVALEEAYVFQAQAICRGVQEVVSFIQGKSASTLSTDDFARGLHSVSQLPQYCVEF